MGQKNFYQGVSAQIPQLQIIAGSFVVNGANAPATINPSKQAKFTVSAPAAGVYTVTLTDGPIVGRRIAVIVSLSPLAANSTARAVHTHTDGLATTGTFLITTQSTAGTDANLAADTAIVNFELLLSEWRGT
jgi:hypothetical protein